MYDSKIAIYNNLSLYNLLKELKLDLSISSISSNEENLDEFIKEYSAKKTTKKADAKKTTAKE